MTIFETKRLLIKGLSLNDKAFFIELLSAPEIIDPIPQMKFSEEENLELFQEHTNYSQSILERDRSVWGIYERDQTALIGLCLFLTNDEGDRELGYRFRKAYWGKGYGTEVTDGVIRFGFNELQLEKITADANVENVPSIKILEKFLKPVREYYHKRDKCVNRRYELSRSDWDG